MASTLKTRTIALATLVLAVIGYAGTADAATPFRVKDIRTFPFSTLSGSSPERFFDVGGITYFIANDRIDGFELWKTDGTAAVHVLF